MNRVVLFLQGSEFTFQSDELGLDALCRGRLLPSLCYFGDESKSKIMVVGPDFALFSEFNQPSAKTSLPSNCQFVSMVLIDSSEHLCEMYTIEFKPCKKHE